MDCECADAAILKLFGKLFYYDTVVVPTQTGLGSNRYGHRIDHSPRDFEHERHIAQQTGSGTFSGDFLDRATKVYVEHIGMSLLNNNLCSIGNGFGLFSIDLNCHGTLFLVNFELCKALVNHSDECVA